MIYYLLILFLDVSILFTKIDINLDEFSKKIELISKSIEDKQQSKLKSIFNKDYTLEDRKKRAIRRENQDYKSNERMNLFFIEPFLCL